MDGLKSLDKDRKRSSLGATAGERRNRAKSYLQNLFSPESPTRRQHTRKKGEELVIKGEQVLMDEQDDSREMCAR